ncbi:hypothetical protein NQ359_16470, partial [Escherichia coli]|uniref:hypothetical protein n=1 Tax=Escherichia coli TaxID=562 RepID=UPI001BC8AB3C
HQLHLILSGLRTLSGSNHWDYAAARRMQERAAVGCYFFPEAENITTVMTMNYKGLNDATA